MLTTLNAKVSATKVCPGCSARYPPDALFCPNDGSPLTASAFADRDSDSGPAGGSDAYDSYLGREISGHIEIRKLAGVGAMGRVYRAFQRGIERDVAVKVLHRELSANQQLVARFHREAKVASRLQHPNVVQVHLAGQLPDGAMYIVMEYLDGLSLQSALAAAGGPLPLERALHIALQICDAAGEAHLQGVVHRDIKPENVMLIRRGDDPDFVKVLDFGIARLNWGEQSMATAAGLIFGTARYISPEGAQGEAVGPAGDVYATATLLYQMLAGRTPFEGEQAVALLVQQIHDAPPPIRSIPAAAKLPEAIASVIMKNLAKSPADRAPDARTFGRALVEAAKTIGLTPEDLVPRSSLFVPQARLSDPGLMMPSAAVVRPSDSSPVVPTVRDPVLPDFNALIGPQAALPPGTKTQKWNPPEAQSAAPAVQLSPAPPVTRLDAFPAGARAGQASRASVDPTLDDSNPVRVPTPTPAPAVRTEPALPPTAEMPVSPAKESPVAASFPPPPSQAKKTLIASGPPLAALLENRLADPEPAPRATRSRGRNARLIAVVLICFLLGALGVSIAHYQLGLFSDVARPGSLDDAVARADDALRHGRWDAPAGDNVRDITNDGLAKWPKDSRIMDLRARATDELVKEAVGRKFAGDQPGALHLARLANELDPTDTTAQHLVEEYERALPKGTVDASASIAPITTPIGPSPRGGSHPPSSPASSAKVSMEASLPHPKIGQPVTFTAKVSASPAPAKVIDDPRFIINGPGLTSDTKLGTLPEGVTTYVATFTGFEAGKYEVSFDAKVDGVAVHAVRALVIDGDGPASSPSTPTLPATVPSGKWL